MIKHLIFTCFIFVCSTFYVSGQHNGLSEYYSPNFIRHDNFVYKEHIKTVLLYKENDFISNPIIALSGEENLLLSFDDLDAEFKTYAYSFIHCNSDWKPSELRESDFINGFSTNYISDYRYSVNTKEDYIHYDLTFPNSNVSFTKSGNYIIKVFEEGDPEHPIITKKFLIFENKVIIKANVKRPTNVEYRNSRQEIVFSLNYGGQNVLNPYEDIKVDILQNFRWDNAIKNIKPRFVQGQELIYDQFEENTFKGSNEFRHFDLKNMKFQTDRIAKIISDSVNIVYLVTEEIRGQERYSSSSEINGKFVVKNHMGSNDEIDSDYAWINFRLKYPSAVADGNIYVFGSLSNWNFSNDFKMKYDYETNTYNASIFLKQGYYNYVYTFVKDGTQKGDESLIEGSFYDTENDYTILVYYKEPGRNFEKLIGISNVNSIRNF